MFFYIASPFSVSLDAFGSMMRYSQHDLSGKQTRLYSVLI